MAHYTQSISQNAGDGEVLSEQLMAALIEFVSPLLPELDARLDKRLVRNFVGALVAILRSRHRAEGLWLVRLGAYLLSPRQALAGAKRLGRLVQQGPWLHDTIEAFLLKRAEAHLQALEHAGEDPLVIWDETVWEKPESERSEGLCVVRSRKGARLTRIRPGFWRPPKGSICVPGLNWLQIVITSLKDVPQLVTMRWWTTRGPYAQRTRQVEEACLRILAQRWGKRVLHVWDRGFAGGPWLRVAGALDVRFVLRWPKGYKLTDAQGRARFPGQITRSKRSLEHRHLWDAKRRSYRKTGIVFLSVSHPEYPHPLTLVVARQKNRPPWFLLTSEPVRNVEDAWHIIRIYARRWDVESSIRCSKTELGFESPRLWKWEHRLNLLALVALVQALLSHLRGPAWRTLGRELLQRWCPRAGRKMEEVRLPFYRLRLAIEAL